MSPPPRPHPLARSGNVERACAWLSRAWNSGLATRPSLDPDVLWAKALASAPPAGESAGRSPRDIADFRLRLDRLTHALHSEAALNPLGLTIAHGQLARTIRQRLQLGALWQNRPDLPQTPIAPPVIVVGQMRSGTTRLHRLLAADPQLAATRFCDSWLPCPTTPDMRPLWAGFQLAVARWLDPWLETIHPFGATRADEELGWLAAALDHCAYEAQWRIPSFTAFSEARDPAPVYAEFARILRSDAAWRGNAAHPRVLKVPQFAEDLPALLAQFPGARVVRTRRDSEDVLASAASLVANQMAIQSDSAEMGWIEGEVARKLALREARMDEALACFDGKLAEVDFAELDADWQGAMALVYRTLELPLGPAAKGAMAGEQTRAAKGAHRHHRAGYKAFAEA